jgi:uncharacterized protein YjaG (DUF416 family)
MSNEDEVDPSFLETYRQLPELVQLRSLITLLPTRRHRIAFATSCCERLYPSYRALILSRRQSDTVRPLIDLLWEFTLGRELTVDELENAAATALSVGLDHDDAAPLPEDAADAIDAVSLTIEALSRFQIDNVVRVAEVLRNKIDRPLWKELAQHYGQGVGLEEERSIEDIVRSHPRTLTEIEIEHDQITYLRNHVSLSRESIGQLITLGYRI